MSLDSSSSDKTSVGKPSLEEKRTKKQSAPKKRKVFKDYFDFKNNQTNQIGLILFSAFVISTSLHYFFENRFSESRWNESTMRRYQMLDDIIDRELFINDTKSEIINQLGQPSDSSSEEIDLFNYHIGNRARFSNNKVKQLTLIFENNRVYKVIVTPRTDFY
ncbi:hypothetical protein [Lacinutrix undariae]